MFPPWILDFLLATADFPGKKRKKIKYPVIDKRGNSIIRGGEKGGGGPKARDDPAARGPKFFPFIFFLQKIGRKRGGGGGVNFGRGEAEIHKIKTLGSAKSDLDSLGPLRCLKSSHFVVGNREREATHLLRPPPPLMLERERERRGRGSNFPRRCSSSSSSSSSPPFPSRLDKHHMGRERRGRVDFYEILPLPFLREKEANLEK